MTEGDAGYRQHELRPRGSRRAALHGAASLVAAAGAFSLRQSAVAQGTPVATAPSDGLMLVQSFGQGTLFPTQGDGEILPYTVILWDAANQGVFFADGASGTAGFVTTESVLTAIAARGDFPRAVVVAAVEEENGATIRQGVWALRLGYGGLGSDPGAVTYQGEPLSTEDAAGWLETAPADLPEGPQDLGAGYLIIAGLPGFAADPTGAIRLTLR